MRCCECKRLIPSGAEQKKMIAEYDQEDGTTKVFGYLMSDGPLARATGRLLRGWHHRCFHVVRKREARGDPLTGRVLSGGALPTGYDIAELVRTRDDADQGLVEADHQGTRVLTERLDKLKEIARTVGKPVGDPTVTEAYRAGEHGGPYPHTHHLGLEMYQLLAHLHYAHGFDRALTGTARSGYEVHAELHAAARLAELLADRDGDPGHAPTEESDWREQVVTELNELQ